MTETFYISIKFIVVFHVNMLQQLQIPVNSINGKHWQTIPSMNFFGCYDQSFIPMKYICRFSLSYLTFEYKYEQKTSKLTKTK